MERRSLLKAALALPLVHSPTAAATGGTPSSPITNSRTIYCGLAGLDFALGDITAACLVSITGPSCTGKTLLLLDLAHEDQPPI